MDGKNNELKCNIIIKDRVKNRGISLFCPKHIKMKLKIINGPNLNLLGLRQPEIYGNVGFDDFYTKLKDSYTEIEFTYFQSNHEGAIIDAIQEMIKGYNGLIINPAAYTHTSIAIADALSILNIPIVEVHISNIYERESFRHHSFTSAVASKTIVGEGLEGYRMAIAFLLAHHNGQ